MQSQCNRAAEPKSDDIVRATTQIKNRAKAFYMPSCANNKHHRTLINHLESCYTIRDDNYPKKTTEQQLMR